MRFGYDTEGLSGILGGVELCRLYSFLEDCVGLQGFLRGTEGLKE